MRLLSVFALLFVAVVLCQSVAEAEPSGGSGQVTGGQVTGTDEDADTSLLHERADSAVSLKATTRSWERGAIAAAAIAFILAAGFLWLLGSRWVSASWLQWIVLLVIPTVAAILVVAWSAEDIQGRLDDMPTDSLRRIPDHPVLGADQSIAEAARYALTLKNAAEHGSLWRTLAMQPALIALGMAGVLLIGVWLWSNKRVLKSA